MKPIIIAEVGANHNGSLETALKLVDAAALSGADYVKFQTFKQENIAAGNDNPRRPVLPYEDFKLIADRCRQNGIGFLATPFDTESIDFLASIKMDYMKVPSGEITNLPYLRRISQLKMPIILSTGMCNLADVENALQVLYDGGVSRNDITVLHCNSQYPTPYSDVNLKAMVTMREAFGVNVGYSDHTPGIVVAIAAVALGASVIEKHFTLDKTIDSLDHIASLDPDELSELVRGVRHVSMALGSQLKRATPSERKNLTAARKSIVAAANIKKGETFTEGNLTVKRPGNGISPMHWDSVLGRTALKSYRPDDPIEI